MFDDEYKNYYCYPEWCMCTPVYTCHLHAVYSKDLIASGWPEPPSGWEAYDAKIKANKEEALKYAVKIPGA